MIVNKSRALEVLNRILPELEKSDAAILRAFIKDCPENPKITSRYSYAPLQDGSHAVVLYLDGERITVTKDRETVKVLKKLLPYKKPLNN